MFTAVTETKAGSSIPEDAFRGTIRLITRFVVIAPRLFSVAMSSFYIEISLDRGVKRNRQGVERLLLRRKPSFLSAVGEWWEMCTAQPDTGMARCLLDFVACLNHNTEREFSCSSTEGLMGGEGSINPVRWTCDGLWNALR
ncbi:unnamed protein product, partial [Ascophyllum nodosum]